MKKRRIRGQCLDLKGAAETILDRVDLRIAIDEALFNPFDAIARRVPLHQVTPALVIGRT